MVFRLNYGALVTSSCSPQGYSQLDGDQKWALSQPSSLSPCSFILRNVSMETAKPPSSLLATCFLLGLPKSSEQAYIEFESIEAIVKTASRTKFFIEFYSTCLEGETNIHQNPLGATAHTEWMQWMK